MRIVGFDLARAYAIFGMFVVNFNVVFGDAASKEGLSSFLNLFNGNSSSIFVMLAGMGVSLFTVKGLQTPELQTKQRSIISKRATFLFVFGLLFYLWWPADILHFYGGYMHLAALVLFVPRRYYIWFAAVAILGFHLLFILTPFETGWNFETYHYIDFWTLEGFLRNTFYNGWNPIFPWVAFFFFGQYLGRLNWQDPVIIKRSLLLGVAIFAATYVLQNNLAERVGNADIKMYLQADYLPPFLPFMMGTAAFGLVIISLCMVIAKRFGEGNIVIKALSATGKLTLTHYVSHIVIGIVVLALITGKPIDESIITLPPSDAGLILGYATVYFFVSTFASYFILKRFDKGPMEAFMRKIAG